jgi:hypothetical protein
LIFAKDPRIGKVPGKRRTAGSGAKKATQFRKRAQAPSSSAKGRPKS